MRVAARACVLGRADVADAAQRVEQRVSHLGRRALVSRGKALLVSPVEMLEVKFMKGIKYKNAKEYANEVMYQVLIFQQFPLGKKSNKLGWCYR